MTNETTYRDKGRAVVLAALMVLSVVAMTVSFTGAAAAAHNSSADRTVANSDLANTGDVWVGQSLQVTGFNANETLQLHQGTSSGPDGDAERVRYIRADGNGNVTIDTSDLSEGPYIIENSSDTDYGPFWVIEQSADFSFASDSTPTNQNVNLEYESNRNGAVDVVVSAEHNGEAVDAGTLKEILGARDHGNEDNEVLLTDVNSSGVSASFSGQELGDYNFTFNVHDSSAEGTASITVEESVGEDVSFDQTTYQGVTGDNLEIGLELASTDTAHLALTYEDTNVGNITLEGVEEDQVTVVVNTYDGTVTVENSDGENITSDVTVTPDGFDTLPLPAVEYDFEAYLDDTADEDVTDAAVVILNERSIDNIGTHVAPSELTFENDDPEDFLNSATERDFVADGDYLITQVDASGIYGYLQNGDTLNNADGLSLTYQQENAGPFDDAGQFNLSDLNTDDYTIYQDAENETFYVIFNTDAPGVTMEEGQQWNAEFEINESNDYIDSSEDAESVDTNVDVEAAETELNGEFDDEDRLQVPNSAESEISAQTNLAPGTTASYYVRFQTEVFEDEATVGEDGMISTTFDFSDRTEGDEIQTVRISPSNAESAESSGIIVASDPEPEANISIDGELTSSEVQVGEEGELVVTVTNSGDAEGTVDFHVDIGGETIHQEELTLAAGEDITRTYTDFNTSEAGSEISWEAHAGNATDEGALSVVESDDPGNSDDTGSDDSGSGDSGSDDSGSGDSGSDDSGSDDSGSDSDDDGTPGFGVGVALVALLGAAMLALRRQN